MLPTGGSDYIFAIDIAGFRIAHFGDLGQSMISDGQLTRIGQIDIAFSQLYNTYSSMDADNAEGIHQMSQVKPPVFIPTHVSGDTARLASTTWKATYTTGPLTIRGSSLPSETTVVFMGKDAERYGQEFNLQPASF